MKSFHLRLGKRKRCLLSPCVFNTLVEVLGRDTAQEKERCKMPARREEIKLLFADDIFLYLQKSEDSIGFFF